MKQILLAVIFASAQEAEANPTPEQAPLALFTVNSRCNDIYDDALVPIALKLATFAADERLGRAAGMNGWHRYYRSEGFRQLYANCLKAESDYEMSLVDPTSNPNQANAALDQALAGFRNFTHAVNSNPALSFVNQNAVEQRWDAELGPKFLGLFGAVRAGEKHLRSSQHLRKSVHLLIDRVLERSVDCRVLAKSNQNSSACDAEVRAAFVEGDAKIRRAVASLASPYSTLTGQLVQAEGKKASGIAYATGLKNEAQQTMAAVQSTEQTLKYLMGQMQQLDQQAKAMDYYQNYYLWYGNYYYNYAVYCWYAGYPYYYYYFLWYAYYYWAWYGYFHHAFVTITQSLMPSLWGTIRAYENQMQAYHQRLNSLKPAIDAADRQVITLIQAVHQKRQQLVSTCLPAPQSANGHGPLCQSFTGKDLL